MNTPCWEWSGKRNADGYGVHKKQLVHRIMYAMFVSPPGKMCVLHRCDNPGCINPDHLFLGTQTENLADMRAKGRDARGERHGRSKLTSTIVKKIIEDQRLLRVIAAEHGITMATVSRIRNRHGWKHL